MEEPEVLPTSAVQERCSLTSGALFAGAGGFATGFYQAGFTPLFFNEVDRKAAQTFRYNFPSTTAFVCPIQEVSAQHIRNTSAFDVDDLDVMIGGPPCQGFSINAPVRSNSDPRNSLFRHYVRIVLEGLRPKFIVMENVPGLLSLDEGETLYNVIAAFTQAGYRVKFHILNAAHYGVAEERWRLFFIGTRLPNVDISFPYPTHYSYQRPNFTGGREYTFSYAIRKTLQPFLDDSLLSPISVAEAINDLPMIEMGGGADEMEYTLPPQSAYQRILRQDNHKLYNHECMAVSPINIERMRYVKPGGSWRDIPHTLLPRGMQQAHRSDHTKRYGRLNPTGISSTILTKCDPHWGTFFHYEQDRVISVREAARIQSFPDWFRFTGTKSDQYRQVGNAVPPLLAQAIAEHIYGLLQNTVRGEDSHYAESRGNDLCEIFGYTPDDTSDNARKQWKSQECPFVGGVCIKHSHPQDGKVLVYGTCSVTNKVRGATENIIICPQRLYANNFASLKSVINDAIGSVNTMLPIYMADEYVSLKACNTLPDEYIVVLGRNSGKEISLSNAGFIALSLDWVMVYMKAYEIQLIVPCEVQSIDTTGNYHANWHAYSHELEVIADSRHGMNWANVWKRLIPQLILKGSVASTSKLCKKGIYFIVPDRVYVQFEKLIGEVASLEKAGEGILTVMTYDLDIEVPQGSIRQLKLKRIVRMYVTEFAKAFASGSQLPLGTQLDTKVAEILATL